MCEYCGCRSITVIGRFTAEHEDIANARVRFENGCVATITETNPGESKTPGSSGQHIHTDSTRSTGGSSSPLC